jgi:hypothetical protein
VILGVRRPTPGPSHAWEGRKILWVIGGHPQPPVRGLRSPAPLLLLRARTRVIDIGGPPHPCWGERELGDTAAVKEKASLTPSYFRPLGSITLTDVVQVCESYRVESSEQEMRLRPGEVQYAAPL